MFLEPDLHCDVIIGSEIHVDAKCPGVLGSRHDNVGFLLENHCCRLLLACFCHVSWDIDRGDSFNKRQHKFLSVMFGVLSDEEFSLRVVTLFVCEVLC